MALDSATLKAEALCWLRYARRTPIVCTESGNFLWPADVLGITKTSAVEVEVKISKKDLLREFVSKKAKHFLYANAKDAQGKTRWIPNYMYFLVPEDLAEKAKQVVGEKQSKAGVLVYVPRRYGRDGTRIDVVKRAAKLHAARPSQELVGAAVMRMGSEICRDALRRAKGKVGPVKMPKGVLDPVEPDEELDARAKILLKAVEGVDWDARPETHEKYRALVRTLSKAHYEEMFYEADGIEF